MKLRSIVYNLVLNAIKYRSPDRAPEIWVSTVLHNEYITLSVKDNGAGIDASQQEAIFAKYVRLPSNTQGSGVGLYLVKEHITKAGGKITLQSEPGKGSEFTVYFKTQ